MTLSHVLISVVPCWRAHQQQLAEGQSRLRATRCDRAHEPSEAV